MNTKEIMNADSQSIKNNNFVMRHTLEDISEGELSREEFDN